MKLDKRITKPEVSSSLEFSDKEVIEALKEYAERKGYLFGRFDLSIYHSRSDAYHSKNTTTLIARSDGIDPPITKGI